MPLVRGALYVIAFHVLIVVMMIICLPLMALPRRVLLPLLKLWARLSVLLLGVIAGTRLEVRGRERLPAGPVLVAAKHQSAFETFALLPLLEDPAFVLKDALHKIPLFGWWSMRFGMIAVRREKGAATMRAMREAVRAAAADGRQIVIFPEGTRRAPDAPPDYKPGTAFLYDALDVPCVPVALNSGLFWPRRSLERRPGTIVFEFLEPIPPGLAGRDFLARLETAIETATAGLVAEGRGTAP